jgi:hypothetical protein
MVPISGFSIVRNAIKLDFPVVESIRSILPACEEVVVNVGTSEDDTLELIRSIGDPRIRIVEAEWDWSDKILALGRETRRAMSACRFPWGIYIQADEVLGEGSAGVLQRTVEEVHPDPRVEALLLKYLHFYGDFATIATNRRWYQREVRCMRLDPAYGVHPYLDAQGFRVGPGNRRIRARPTSAVVYHYGWARPPAMIQRKREFTRSLYPEKEQGERPLLPWIPLLRPFTGTHPPEAREWVAQRAPAPGEPRVSQPKFDWRWPRLYASNVIKHLTGIHPFEFRNYEVV